MQPLSCTLNLSWLFSFFFFSSFKPIYYLAFSHKPTVFAQKDRSSFIESRPSWKEVIHEFHRNNIPSLPISITRKLETKNHHHKFSNGLLGSLRTPSKDINIQVDADYKITSPHIQFSRGQRSIVNL